MRIKIIYQIVAYYYIINATFLHQVFTKHIKS